MNFQQLRIIRETVRQNFNLTEVANALYASQSGVSKHIKDLEDELGLELFIRKGKRFLGLTDPGKELLVIVERMLLDAANIRRLAEQFSQRDEGQLTIATTHTQARYALPRVVTAFKAAFPKVHLVLHQASPSELVRLLQEGEADIGIATEALADHPELITLPCYDWQHALVLPTGHPLLERERIALEDLAQVPLITYHPSYTGRSRIDQAFAQRQLKPHIVLDAIDSDVIKTYVKLGLGVGIVAEMAMQGDERSPDLVSRPLGYLFGHNVSRVAFKRGAYLRQFVLRFAEFLSERLSRELIHKAMLGGGTDYEL